MSPAASARSEDPEPREAQGAGPRTLFEKIWDAHIVRPEEENTPALLYVDLHLVHEVTSPQAFDLLRDRGLSVRRPERTVATMDVSVSVWHSDRTTVVRATWVGDGCFVVARE